MTAGTECVSVAAEKPTMNWPTWHCQEACSRTVLLRPETLDCRRLTVWTAQSADGSIRQSGVLVDQARWRHALANWGSMVCLCAGLCMSEQPSCTVSILGLTTSETHTELGTQYLVPSTSFANETDTRYRCCVRFDNLPNLLNVPCNFEIVHGTTCR